MILATGSPEGRPSARVVLLKEICEQGLVFYTNYCSRKAIEMERNPFVSVAIFWEPLGYQVRIEGRVEKVSARKSDLYFSSRPRGSQLSAWASAQSSEIPSRAHLEHEISRLEKIYNGKPVPRPPWWGGYLLVPDHFEFWKEGKNRLHDRVMYEIAGKNWTRKLLAP